MSEQPMFGGLAPPGPSQDVPEAEDRGQLGIEEPGDGGDPVSREGEDGQAGRVGGRGVGLSEIAGEGGLGVGPGGLEPEAPPRSPRRARPQEPGDGLGPVVLIRGRRHGQPGVVGEQCHQCADVVGAESVGMPCYAKGPLPPGKGPELRKLVAGVGFEPTTSGL